MIKKNRLNMDEIVRVVVLEHTQNYRNKTKEGLCI